MVTWITVAVVAVVALILIVGIIAAKGGRSTWLAKIPGFTFTGDHEGPKGMRVGNIKSGWKTKITGQDISVKDIESGTDTEVHQDPSGEESPKV